MQLQTSQKFDVGLIAIDMIALIASIVGYISVSFSWFGDSTGNELIAMETARYGFVFSAESGTAFMLPNPVVTASVLAGIIALAALIISFFPQRIYKHFAYIALLLVSLYGLSYYVSGYFNGRQSASEFDYWLSNSVGIGMWIGAGAMLMLLLVSIIGLIVFARRLQSNKA
jgi:hypothetical protein